MAILFQNNVPVTQDLAAVRALITYQNHGQEPKEMPPFYRLSEELVLVRSNKKDAYYVATPTDCSCPAKVYNPGEPCEHSRKFFSPARKSQAELEGEAELARMSGAKKLAKPPEDLRPEGKWPGGMNGPVNLQAVV